MEPCVGVKEIGLRAAARDAAPGHEFEIKFAADPGRLEAVLNRLAGAVAAAPSVQHLVSTYFDTADHALWRGGLVLRVRSLGGQRFVMGVKARPDSDTGIFARREIEVPVADKQPDLARLPKKLARRLAKRAGRAPLRPLFKSQVNRRTLVVQQPAATFEIALDAGAIVSAGDEHPLCEIEIELKSGAPAALCAFAAGLAAAHDLRLSFASKAARGYRLLDGGRAGAVVAAPRKLPKHCSLRSALVAITGETLAQFTANWDAFTQSPSPEVVHQLRVALRRLRSACTIFKPVLPREAGAEIAAAARAIGAGFTPAREADVLLRGLRGIVFPAIIADAERQTLRQAVAALRERAYRDAAAYLAGPAATAMVIRLEGLLAEIAGGAAGPPALDAPAADFAAKAIAALQRRALKRGRHLETATPQERHRLRLALKTLRYGCEFFTGLMPRAGHVRRCAETAGRLQDLLGAANDLAAAERLLAEALDRSAEHGARAPGFVLGWMSRDVARGRPLVAAEWRRFRRAAKS